MHINIYIYENECRYIYIYENACKYIHMNHDDACKYIMKSCM